MDTVATKAVSPNNEDDRHTTSMQTVLPGEFIHFGNKVVFDNVQRVPGGKRSAALEDGGGMG